MSNPEYVVLKEDKNQNAISLANNDQVLSGKSSVLEMREKEQKLSDSYKNSRGITFAENVVKPQIIYVASASNPENSPRQALHRIVKKSRTEENSVSRPPCTVSFTVDVLKPKVIYVSSSTMAESPEVEDPVWPIESLLSAQEEPSIPLSEDQAEEPDQPTEEEESVCVSYEDVKNQLEDVPESEVTLNDRFSNAGDAPRFPIGKRKAVKIKVTQNSSIHKTGINMIQDRGQGEQETTLKEVQKEFHSDDNLPVIYSSRTSVSTTILDETCCSVSVISNYDENELEVCSNLSLDDCAIEDGQTFIPQVQCFLRKSNSPDAVILDMTIEDSLSEKDSTESAFAGEDEPIANDCNQDNQECEITNMSTATISDDLNSYTLADQSSRLDRSSLFLSRVSFTLSLFFRMIHLNCLKHSRKIIIGLIVAITCLLMVCMGLLIY